jgi:predicted enzyme related to lactoylglutathione lyase
MRTTIVAALLLTLAASLPAAQQKERVDGFGGFFFRAQSPKTLAQWYSDHLGVTVTPTGYGGESWKQEAGTTVFQPFPATTKYWRAEKAFMLNFRVKNLDALVAQLRKADIKVDVDPMTYPNGRFASLEDPEGNPIQLWEPKGK